MFSPIRATYSAHYILFDLIILVILDEEYKLWSSSFTFLSQLSWANLPYTDFLRSTFQISCPFSLA
jgi:hypothetical protein